MNIIYHTQKKNLIMLDVRKWLFLSRTTKLIHQVSFPSRRIQRVGFKDVVLKSRFSMHLLTSMIVENMEWQSFEIHCVFALFFNFDSIELKSERLKWTVWKYFLIYFILQSTQVLFMHIHMHIQNMHIQKLIKCRRNLRHEKYHLRLAET